MGAPNIVSAVILALFLAAAATPGAAIITCSQVGSRISPCVAYLKGTGGPVPALCCVGIRGLNSAASTTPDRQAACRCLKAAASAIQGFNLGLAAGLPRKCGVNIPYKISPSTDCNTVK
uniref:Non-specific lipid-transfer protein n=1 Tax=Kalanchoe fedtschenkoi TaxID=63787 RepID=A0A7N1A9X6_KALFE